jgi:hypothetical protein
MMLGCDWDAIDIDPVMAYAWKGATVHEPNTLFTHRPGVKPDQQRIDYQRTSAYDEFVKSYNRNNKKPCPHGPTDCHRNLMRFARVKRDERVARSRRMMRQKLPPWESNFVNVTQKKHRELSAVDPESFDT